MGFRNKKKVRAFGFKKNNNYKLVDFNVGRIPF